MALLALWKILKVVWVSWFLWKATKTCYVWYGRLVGSREDWYRNKTWNFKL